MALDSIHPLLLILLAVAIVAGTSWITRNRMRQSATTSELPHAADVPQDAILSSLAPPSSPWSEEEVFGKLSEAIFSITDQNVSIFPVEGNPDGSTTLKSLYLLAADDVLFNKALSEMTPGSYSDALDYWVGVLVLKEKEDFERRQQELEVSHSREATSASQFEHTDPDKMLDTIDRLSAMRKMGTISEEEFSRAKGALLRRLGGESGTGSES